MLTIRLTRKGKKNQPFFRVVVIDKRRSSKGGRAVEEVGYVDPLTKRHSLKKDRILHWIKMGAQPTARIHNLLVSEKIIDAPKIKQFSVTKKAKAAATPKAGEPRPEAGREALKASAPAAAPAGAAETPATPVAETPAPDVSAEASAKEEAKPAEPEKTA